MKRSTKPEKALGGRSETWKRRERQRVGERQQEGKKEWEPEREDNKCNAASRKKSAEVSAQSKNGPLEALAPRRTAVEGKKTVECIWGAAKTSYAC